MLLLEIRLLIRRLILLVKILKVILLIRRILGLVLLKPRKRRFKFLFLIRLVVVIVMRLLALKVGSRLILRSSKFIFGRVKVFMRRICFIPRRRFSVLVTRVPVIPLAFAFQLLRVIVLLLIIPFWWV